MPNYSDAIVHCAVQPLERLETTSALGLSRNMKSKIARLTAIACVWMSLTAAAIADDFYYYFDQGTGYYDIGGTTFFGAGNQNFLSYPCVHSNSNYGFGAEWWGIVDSNVPVGVYHVGGPAGGESVVIEIY